MSEKLTEELVSLIFDTSQFLREKIKKIKRSANCSFLHVQTLHYIKDNQEISMKEIASFLHITPPSVTFLINSLVKAGLIKRVNDTKDRRVISLLLTEKGEIFLQKRRGQIAKLMKDNLNKLNLEEKHNLLKILKKLSIK